MSHKGMGDILNDSSSTSEEDDNSDYPQLNSDLSMPGSSTQKHNVLVTGFGAFGEHSVNASWEAVKELQKRGVAYNVNLITVEIPVEYEAVQKLIPELWEKYKPQLVVHVGVSSYARELTFETIAHNEGYKQSDITGKSARSQCFSRGAANCLKTDLDVDTLCMDVNEGGCLVMAMKSTDAGRYLCEYSFYASLKQSTSNVSFIHVPPLDSPYTAAELGHGLQVAIQSMMKQLHLYNPLTLPADHWLDYTQGRDTALQDQN